jgi:hypothetical protein
MRTFFRTATFFATMMLPEALALRFDAPMRQVSLILEF